MKMLLFTMYLATVLSCLGCKDQVENPETAMESNIDWEIEQLRLNAVNEVILPPVKYTELWIDGYGEYHKTLEISGISGQKLAHSESFDPLDNKYSSLWRVSSPELRTIEIVVFERTLLEGESESCLIEEDCQIHDYPDGDFGYTTTKQVTGCYNLKLRAASVSEDAIVSLVKTPINQTFTSVYSTLYDGSLERDDIPVDCTSSLE